MRRVHSVAIYVGGFVGPFSGTLTAAMLPEVGRTYKVSSEAAAYSLSAYLLPFAALLVVSGSLGARWGAARTIRVAYLWYAVASAVCALAGSFPVFLAARAAQGIGNAFTTPLVMVALATTTAPSRLNRALGIYAAIQAGGATMAPLVGGVAAELSWRLAFAGVAVLTLGLAAVGLPATGLADVTAKPPMWSSWRRRPVLRVGAIALITWACLGAVAYLVAFRAQDAFQLTSTARGLLLAGFGLASMLSMRITSQALDRFGAPRTVLAGALGGASLLALVGVLPSLYLVAALWALAGVATQLIQVGLNSLSLGEDIGNRSGAVSVIQSLRFAGGAASPAVFTPLYNLAPVAGFLAPAVVLAVAVPRLLRIRRGRGGPDPASIRSPAQAPQWTKPA